MKTLDPFSVPLDRTVLVEASAGTGKTYTITTLFCRLIAEGFPVESVLVVTFTEAAAAELKLRIRRRLSETLEKLKGSSTESDDNLVNFLRNMPARDLISQRLSLALSCFDQAGIFTIHSFCLKILQENAFDCSFPFEIEVVPEISDNLKRAVLDFFSIHVNDQDPLFIKFLDAKAITPERFLSSFSGVISRQDFKIIPDEPVYNPDYIAYRRLIERLREILTTGSSEIIRLISTHDGIDKRTYSKRYVPGWIEASIEKIDEEGENTLFLMEPKKDPLYRFASEQIASKTKKGEPPTHELFDLCQELVGFYNNFETGLIRLKHQFFSFIGKALESARITESICFFDDLVNHLFSVLDGPAAPQLKTSVRSEFKACLIDEFQDTDPAQYQIFSRLFGIFNTPFFMIGDPKQAIYAFRGGDIFAYLRAVKQSDLRYTLKRNYRSSPLMVSAVNSIFSLDPNPFHFSEIEFTPITTPESAIDRLLENNKPLPPLDFRFVDRESVSTGKDGYITSKKAGLIIPDLVAGDILSLIHSNARLADHSGQDQRKICPGDIAVLVRTNEQAGLVKNALNMLNISAVLSKSESVFDTEEAVELYDILIAVNEPRNKGYVKSALCTCVYGYTVEEAFSLFTDDDAAEFWLEKFRNYKKVWEEKGFVSMIMSLFHSDEAFLNEQSGVTDRRLTNFYHLVELISQAETAHGLSSYYLIRWYINQLNGRSRETASSELRLESDRDAVSIVTIHKSKGLEYPIVYLPYLWESRPKPAAGDVLFHNPGNGNALTMDIGSSSIEQAKQYLLFEAQAENRRLLYVAMTRASAMCRIIWGGFKNTEESALGSLIHTNGCRTDDIMLEDIGRLCSDHDQCISIQKINAGSPVSGKFLSDKTDVAELTARTRTVTVPPDWKVSSFSSISKEAGHFLGTSACIDSKQGRKITLFDFPKGAIAGEAFHQIFENIDFKSELTDIETTARSVFENFGFSENYLTSTGIEALAQILSTSLDTCQDRFFRLRDIPAQQRINELEFLFPAGKIDPKIFQKAIKMSGSAAAGSGYIDSLTNLENSHIDHFIKGFIDLLICHEDKWYLLDYKTNYLGDYYSDYTAENIITSMAEHHYFLQYYIYLVALHRYLGMRMQSYDYDTHFGGVFYLFIRGMHPDYGSKYGVFYDRPNQTAIDFLSDNLQ